MGYVVVLGLCVVAFVFGLCCVVLCCVVSVCLHLYIVSIKHGIIVVCGLFCFVCVLPLFRCVVLFVFCVV